MRVGWTGLPATRGRSSGDFWRLAGEEGSKHESLNFFFLSPCIPLAGSWLRACRSGPPKRQWGPGQPPMQRHQNWGPQEREAHSRWAGWRLPCLARTANDRVSVRGNDYPTPLAPPARLYVPRTLVLATTGASMMIATIPRLSTADGGPPARRKVKPQREGKRHVLGPAAC